ncbi:MAG: phosphorylase [Alicyclobacillus sp.]|nr:phosphorylase [Alicyclobacillus sp.]
MVILLLAAMAFEAAPFRKQDWPSDRRVVLAVTGVGPRAARACAEAQIAACRPDWVVGVGVCGGLDAASRIGDAAVPLELVSDDGGRPIPTDARRVQGGSGRMVSVRRVASTVDEKRRLAQQYEARWVDQESYAWGTAAQAAGVPFVVVRTVLDAGADALPGWRRPSSWANVARLPAQALLARRHLTEVGRRLVCELS